MNKISLIDPPCPACTLRSVRGSAGENIGKMENVLEQIRAERERQNAKWGEQNHRLIEWQAILMEEVGEAAKEATDFHFKNPPKPYWTGTFEECQTQRLSDYRKELIQVAAVAVQMIECLDRNGQ